MQARIALAIVLAAAALALAGAAPAHAFDVVEFSGAVSDQGGNAVTQAGAHPFKVSTTIQFSSRIDERGYGVPDGQMKDVLVELPPGFVGAPNAVPACSVVQLSSTGSCAGSTQVGTISLIYSFFDGSTGSPGIAPIYNVEAPSGAPAQFAFYVVGVGVIALDAEVRPGDHGITVMSANVSEGLPIVGSVVEFWGVPADPAHDAERFCDGSQGCAAGVPRRAFLTTPGDCAAGPLTTTLRARSWQTPDEWVTASFDEDVNGVPMAVEGCEDQPFEPSISIEVDSTTPDSPTGLGVKLELPQQGLTNPDGIAPSHLRDVSVVLPDGMTINPSSAGGLAACSDAQIAIGSDAPVTCPQASKIGTVFAKTPVLDETLEGGVYVGTQKSSDPQSGEMFRIFLHLANEERGLSIKLGGKVRVDPQTGRIETTFDDNPQLPVSEIELRLKGGPRAPLATPPTCGVKTVDASLTSWGGHAVERSDSFTVDCPGAGGFAPAFAAGATSPTGGAFSPFAVRIDRSDRQQYLSGVRVGMPAGVLAKLRGVPLCGSDAAANGGCPEGSRIGTTTVAAGPGASPYVLQGPVYLTEGYKGAPYGLAVHVHAKAGPFDLGWVRVRQALHVDPETAEVTAVSDPLPQIVKGVPVRLRSADVDIDRPGFTINPTSCAEKRVEATLTSIDGAVHKTGSRFQASDCRALGFRPRLGMRLVGRRQMRSGGHPTLRATLRQGGGQANLEAAKVTLPPNVVLDNETSNDPELLCGYDASLKADCPASSIIGKATLRTPLLNRPLSGPVHFVQGIRIGATGNRIRTLPTLLVKLRGEVAINLRSRTNTDSKDRLVSIFPNVPDARAGRFDIQIDGSRKGILVVTENRRGRINLCNRRQTALVETDGHNGKRADYPVRVKTACAKTSKTKSGKRR